MKFLPEKQIDYSENLSQMPKMPKISLIWAKNIFNFNPKKRKRRDNNMAM